MFAGQGMEIIDGNNAAMFTEWQDGCLPGEQGLEWSVVENGRAEGRFVATRRHFAPNGFMHAASVIALTDTACAYGSLASMPEGASGVTTIELKTNFLGTAKEGETIICRARLAHGGRMTQVWDAEAVNETTGKIIALFRCTQMILYPR